MKQNIESVVDFINEEDPFEFKFNLNDIMIQHIYILTKTKSKVKLTKYINKVFENYYFESYYHIDRQVKNNSNAFLNILIGKYLKLGIKDTRKVFDIYNFFMVVNTPIQYRFFTLLIMVIAIAHVKNLNFDTQYNLKRFLKQFLNIPFPKEYSSIVYKFSHENKKSYINLYENMFKKLQNKSLQPDINTLKYLDSFIAN